MGFCIFQADQTVCNPRRTGLTASLLEDAEGASTTFGGSFYPLPLLLPKHPSMGPCTTIETKDHEFRMLNQVDSTS